MKLFAALALIALPASADTIRLMGTTVTLQDTLQPGAVAEIHYHNHDSNGPTHEGEYPLSHAGLTAQFSFDWNAAPGGADQINVTVPEGYVAVPPSLTLPENREGVIYIYTFDAVGM